LNADHDANENVRDLLSGLSEARAAAVRPLLLSLQSMAQGEVPAPSPELVAVLEANGGSGAPAPRRPRHRGFVFSLALVGALAAGAGTATAVSPEFRSGAAHAIAGIINAIPFGNHTVLHSTPSAPPPSIHTPGAPGKIGSTSHPTPSPGGQGHSKGDSKSSGHANPKSTDHPKSTGHLPSPAGPPAKGHSTGAP
jgi:hypothetical protein